MTTDLWKQGELVELTITDQSHDGEGVGRVGGRVVFVPDTVVGDRLQVRLVHVKPQYAHGKVHTLLEPSPHRIRPHCIVADKCGGCQWQHIDYGFQRALKRNHIIQTLERIGGLVNPPVDEVLAIADPFAYRNKATYPLQFASHNPQKSAPVVHAGYFQKGSHHLINLNQCPIQDQRLNPLLAEIKLDIQARGWMVYDEKFHRGELRHLGLRIGRHTGEMLLTLVSRTDQLPGLEEQAQIWLDRYPNLVGVCLNLNPQRSNVIFGDETRCIAGSTYLRETFAGLQFHIQPTTFFQVNTEQAEALVQVIENELQLQGTETLLDAYCGIGTLVLPLAHRVKRAIALEIQPDAVELAQHNADLNQITNVTFAVGAVEETLPRLNEHLDVVLLDPPRKGCAPTVLDTLLQLQPHRIVYVSCNPATLSRDLKHLCQSGMYQLTRVQPADFFPQTAHIECAAFLVRI